jgi:hypothetical protein
LAVGGLDRLTLAIDVIRGQGLGCWPTARARRKQTRLRIRRLAEREELCEKPVELVVPKKGRRAEQKRRINGERAYGNTHTCMGYFSCVASA